ncbi:MAG TPA: hypothetical protein VFE05_11635 [Longimicrobiaceae bacterium]|jgi:hypothetical protein|nr:hypothetical protein [Longimicrobiaceae bacterium]
MRFALVGFVFLHASLACTPPAAAQSGCPAPVAHAREQVAGVLADARLAPARSANGMASVRAIRLRPLEGRSDEAACARLATHVHPDTGHRHTWSFYEADGFYFAVVQYEPNAPPVVRHADGRISLNNEELWDQVWIFAPDFRLLTIRLR